MEELKKNKVEDKIDIKILWEAPKLISLDKGKTEGGPALGNSTEGTSYTYKGS